MATKEYREFYLRAAAVLSGSKPDQEIPFPVEYQIQDPNGVIVTVNNRLLNGHVPNEDVYRKLLESIPFILNQEDTAKTSAQGLVILADDQQAFDQESHDPTTEFARAVMPHQMPEPTSAADAVIGGLDEKVVRFEKEIYNITQDQVELSINLGSTDLYRIRYRVHSRGTVIVGADPADSIHARDGIEAALSTIVVPANTLKVDGDRLDYRSTFSFAETPGPSGIATTIKVTIGTTDLPIHTVTLGDSFIKVEVRLMLFGTKLRYHIEVTEYSSAAGLQAAAIVGTTGSIAEDSTADINVVTNVNCINTRQIGAKLDSVSVDRSRLAS